MSRETAVKGGNTLACTAEASAFQKAFGQEMKRRVVDEGEPFVIAQAAAASERDATQTAAMTSLRIRFPLGVSASVSPLRTGR